MRREMDRSHAEKRMALAEHGLERIKHELLDAGRKLTDTEHKLAEEVEKKCEVGRCVERRGLASVKTVGPGEDTQRG